MKKVYETLKFVLRAILFAFILVNLSKIWGIMSNVFTWCTTTDLGYVWVINIAAGAIVAGLIGLATRKYREQYTITITVVKTTVFALVVLIIECFIWHLKDSWEILKAPIATSDIILALLGLVAATLSFVWHLRGVNYDDDDYYEDRSPRKGRGPREDEPPKEGTGETGGSSGGSSGGGGGFDWGSGSAE